MRFVIDTSILIDQLRGGNKWNEFIASISKDSEIYLPSVVVFELFAGLSSRKKEIIQKISNYRLFFKLVDMNWEISRRAGEIFRDKLVRVEAGDCMIAATAIEIGAQVVTLNKKHFSKIPQVVVYDS